MKGNWAIEYFYEWQVSLHQILWRSRLTGLANYTRYCIGITNRYDVLRQRMHYELTAPWPGDNIHNCYSTRYHDEPESVFITLSLRTEVFKTISHSCEKVQENHTYDPTKTYIKLIFAISTLNVAMLVLSVLPSSYPLCNHITRWKLKHLIT